MHCTMIKEDKLKCVWHNLLCKLNNEKQINQLSLSKWCGHKARLDYTAKYSIIKFAKNVGHYLIFSTVIVISEIQN